MMNQKLLRLILISIMMNQKLLRLILIFPLAFGRPEKGNAGNDKKMQVSELLMRLFPAELKTIGERRTLKRRRRKKKRKKASPTSPKENMSLPKEENPNDNQAPQTDEEGNSRDKDDSTRSPRSKPTEATSSESNSSQSEDKKRKPNSSSGTTTAISKSSSKKQSSQTKLSSSLDKSTEEVDDLNLAPMETELDVSKKRPNNSPAFQTANDAGKVESNVEEKSLGNNGVEQSWLDNTNGSQKQGEDSNGGNQTFKKCKRFKSFNTTLLIEHDGEDMDKDTETLELLELGKSFLELYNTMNKPNKDPERCDNLFRKIESVEVQGMGSFERVFEDNSYDVRRIHLYHITASCHGGCNSQTTLFDTGRETGNQRARRLGKEQEQRTIWYAEDSGVSDERCHCDGWKKKMSPTVEEFVSEFSKMVSKLYYRKDKKKTIKTDVNSATAIFELQEVQCKRLGDQDKFETTVYVDYEGDALKDLDKIDSKMEDHLTRSFRYSYNELANLFCDPLQRKVEKVQVTDEELDRRLRKRGIRRRFKYKIRGTCKKCPRKSKLFQDTMLPTNNRFLQSGQHDFLELNTLERITSSFAFERRLKHESGDEDDRCFCSRHPLTERAPTTDEFTFWYDQTRHLAEGVKVTSVSEIPK